MPDKDNFFYFDDDREGIDILDQETQNINLVKVEEHSKEDIKSDVLDTVRKGLNHLKDWFACPNCNAIFKLGSGEIGNCPVCKYRFRSQRGELHLLSIPEGKVEESEELIEELLEGEEGIEKEEEFESIKFTDQFSLNEEVLNVKKIGESKCPKCDKIIDWDSVEPRTGLFYIVKDCSNCKREIYRLNYDDEKKAHWELNPRNIVFLDYDEWQKELSGESEED
ncbi:hypothetical protein ES703_62167 [subsurface metagenome]